MCTSSRGWVATILSMGTFCCFALKVMHWQHFTTCFFACTAIWDQTKWLCIRLSILLSSIPVHSWQYQLKQCHLGPFWQNFSVQDTLPRLEVVLFPKELLELGPVLHFCTYLIQDGVCQLGLLPVFGSQTGDLQTVLHWVYDMQVAAV